MAVCNPGATIFEATAGNTGVGLALIASGRGYKTVLAVPEGFSQEKVTLMEAFGAEVIRTPRADGMREPSITSRNALPALPIPFIAGQFENQDNPDFHYETTAREFYDQLGGQIDAIVIGCGTGGTFTGVARYLKERNPKTLAIAVETQGSVLGGGPKGDHEVEGIGASFIPKTFDGSLADEIIAVSDHDAFDMVKKLAGDGRCARRDRAPGRMCSRASTSHGDWVQASASPQSFPTPPNAICRRTSSISTRNNT